MTRKLSYLTIVGNTAYLYCKELNYLLPITITGNCLNNIIRVNDFSIPHIHNTFIRTLKAFDTKVVSIRIYAYIQDTFLAYINILRGSRTLEINSNFEDCLVLITNTSVIIQIEEKLLKKKGFFVSKRMVEKALIDTT